MSHLCIWRIGKSNFMDFKATGSSTFMQKEVLVNKLQGFMQVAMSNPITAPMVDARELLQQVWDAAETGKESVILDEEAIKTKGANPQIQQMQQQFQEQMQQMQGQAQQAIQQAQKQIEVLSQQNQALQQQVKDKQADTMIKAQQQRIDEALGRMESMIANRDSIANADLKQAQAVKTVMEAGLLPDQHAMSIAMQIQEATNGTYGTQAADNFDDGSNGVDMAPDSFDVAGQEE